jgi:glycosyltransferase involved in cell wall biosynthesis
MKIAAVIENDLSAGGGFNQALNAVLQMASLCHGRYEFVVLTSLEENVPWIKSQGLEVVIFRGGIVDKFLSLAAVSPLLRNVQGRIKFKGRLEHKLDELSVDLVYFVTPGTRCLSLQNINYIATVWDIAHRDFPEFPEGRKNNTFLAREHTLATTLKQAIVVLADSNDLKEKLVRYYGLDSARLVVMPFGPSPFINQPDSRSLNHVISKYGLEPGYFFYPAQFWPHKNHIILIKALSTLVAKGLDCKLVLSGKDYGNQVLIESAIKYHGIEKNVFILGFVPKEDIRALYEGCAAVVMPTYFGPTNLPPLEAWGMGKPLVYSSHLSEQVAGAALIADPDSEQEWATAMEMVLDPSLASTLVERGKLRMMETCELRGAAEDILLSKLERFSKRLHCWRNEQ